MISFGIETSCDETSVAFVEDAVKIKVNLISSQVKIHQEYGGVVPEIASRKHLENINVLIDQALEQTGISWDQVDLISATKGPGLVGALLVGVAAAKSLSVALDLPLIGVNHLVAHVYANFLEHPDLRFPFLALIVSGGHTCLVEMKEHFSWKTLGATRDDAAGEAFDKVARILDLGYPGGPVIDQLAKKGDPEKIRFPRSYLEPDSLGFSYSGLKTSVMNAQKRGDLKGFRIEDIAASFQEAVVDPLVEKTRRAVLKTGIKQVLLAGGVACNSRLRERLKQASEKFDFALYYPSPKLCTDNAAMIACAGSFLYQKGVREDLGMDVIPQLEGFLN
ncbi:MAG: tRNA (adenosine(37)-N6)-threonylcarbamoyltransferase complex transferase subunit TsaD [Candidatus Eremiobacteraeota bacterium]|jgi:N6-L-threonylcarbamoyladenine synthase|nr:tRNA (adenosine(37)-N6)-threonylcarbamoyltransferase complex transferase subunit TsaD [Candidatus Eremiobacteraeota bacterium]MCL5056084.1 tRNA (adenosine(37)-N6)-threonylcarbamoyltransferase complex transferase subunit TsaD [Bacillota bacterium]